jgi:ABC-2 type transport system permease protein
MVVVSLIATSLIFSVMPIASISQIRNIAPEEVLKFMSYFPNFSPDRIMMEIILKHWKILFLMIPGMLPIIIAAHSFGSERKNSSLEALFSTPTSDLEILVAKMISAFLPSQLAVFLSFGILAIGINHYSNSIVGTSVLPDAEWLLIVFLLGPLFGLFTISMTVFLSSRIADTRAVQQIGSFVIMPLLALSVGQLYGLVMLSTKNLILASIGMALADIVLVFFAARIFNREKILTSW